MKNKNVIVIIAFVLVAALCFGVGFLAGDKDEEVEATSSTTVSASVTESQPTTQMPVSQIIPAEVTLTYNQEGTRVILTDFYKMQIPDSWGDVFSYEKITYGEDGSYGLHFRHDKSYAENSGGHLFTIELHSTSTDYAAELEKYSPTPFDFVGTISVPGQDEYQVIVTYSSDCQYSDAYENEHNNIMNTLSDALNTIEGINGTTYEKLI